MISDTPYIKKVSADSTNRYATINKLKIPVAPELNGVVVLVITTKRTADTIITAIRNLPNIPLTIIYKILKSQSSKS